MVPKPENRISQLTWVILSALGFILFIAAAIVLINFSNKTGNIKPQIFYLLLIPIGLIAAGFLFGALKSHAKYTGKVYGGTLELGGPTVIFVIVIYLGIKFTPADKTFTLRFTVFGSQDKSELISSGMLKVLFDKPDSTQILNGTANFTEISTDVQGKKITVIPVVADYYVSAQEINVPESGSVELHLKRKPDSTAVSGIVVDAGGQPVRQAVIELADGTYTCKSDDFGNFKLTLPVKEGAELPIRVYYKSRLCYNNTQMLSKKVPLTLQIH